ncbi:hypothetical protein QYF36_004677 [Acer negundo]|nr:hypothetical protein QYF36_004677 [Acer negundo]
MASSVTQLLWAGALGGCAVITLALDQRCYHTNAGTTPALYQAAMEMSRRERKERLRVEQDPREKGLMVDERAELSDDE